MTVPEGFTVELVAAEPDLINPIAMTFDDRGRIWVTESLEYPRKEAGPGRDRIKILEDTRGSGRADKATVFAEGLNIPTGIAIGYGGVWVLNAPDLLFMKEKDGKEVSREVVISGFGRTDTRSGETPQETASSRRYALGVNTCAAPRSSRSRATRSPRTAAPPASRWNSSTSPPTRPRRRERSNAGSAVSLTTYGVRATKEPSALRPNIPVV